MNRKLSLVAPDPGPTINPLQPSGGFACTAGGASPHSRLSCSHCGFSCVWDVAEHGRPSCPGCSTVLTYSASTEETEALILEASPSDLVRLLTGAVLQNLGPAATRSRAHLHAAHLALDADLGDLPTALQSLREGLALAIGPDHVEASPETALLQVAYWLLAMQQQSFEVLAAAMLPAGQTKH